jgi:hypothetical protein
MLVTEFGIVTVVSPLQLRNAKSPMLVTEFGIVTVVSPLQPKNALFARAVTEKVLPLYVTDDGIIRLPVG